MTVLVSIRCTVSSDRRTIRRFTAAMVVAVLVSGSALGCDEPTSQFTVEVCGDADVPRQLDALRLKLLDDQGEVRDRGLVELLKCPSGRVSSLPVRASFKPFNGEGRIVVQGLKRQKVVLRTERRVKLSANTTSTVRLPATTSCLGVVRCGQGRTCVQGTCQLLPSRDDSLSCRSMSPDGTSGPSDATSDTSDVSDTSDISDTGPSDSGTSADGGDLSEEGTLDPRFLCPTVDPPTTRDASDLGAETSERETRDASSN